MIEKKQIEEAISQYLEENNLILDDVKVNKENNIKIFFDAPDREVCIDDCVALSRYFESRFDREAEDYSLMVSSSGKEKNNKIK